uniref:Tyrosine-protein phosphatase domain-containing protein n=1 Tax=Steinernema glaseri TaxID=37863 RepID=A0A1I7YLK9_9BILA
MGITVLNMVPTRRACVLIRCSNSLKKPDNTALDIWYMVTETNLELIAAYLNKNISCKGHTIIIVSRDDKE